MQIFQYKHAIRLTDRTALKLKITKARPWLLVWQKDGKIYITPSNFRILSAKFHSTIECKMIKEGWIGNIILPFPWEKEYVFERIEPNVWQLKPTRPKEQYNVKKTTTIPNKRRTKTKPTESMRQPEPTPYGENPDLIDTLI